MNTESGMMTAATPAAPSSLEELKTALDAMRELLASVPEGASTYMNLYVFCTDLLNLVGKRIRDLEPGAEITPGQLESVCVLLGPFRNLTTLTCSILSLHPQCVVLNHGGLRTLTNPRLNFLADYSPDKILEFVRYAGFASRSGTRGPYGGDIRLSHAFDREPMRQAQARLQGSAGGPTTCLVWKDSHRVTNFLRSAQVDVRHLLRCNEKIKFLLPIRNPIDCAISNLRKGHVQLFATVHGISTTSPVQDVVGAVLDEIAWFLTLQKNSGRPENFLFFFEHEMGRGVLEKLLTFLRLPHDDAYLTATADAFKGTRTRRKDEAIVEIYADQVTQKFGRFPEVRDALLQFAHPSP